MDPDDQRRREIDVIARPQIAVTPASAAPGRQVTVTGGDFGYETTVTLFLDQAGGTFLGTAQPSGEGPFTVSVTIPASRRPVPTRSSRWAPTAGRPPPRSP